MPIGRELRLDFRCGFIRGSVDFLMIGDLYVGPGIYYERDIMEETYKGHAISSEAKEVPETDEWKPIVRVEWDERGQQRSKSLGEWNFLNSFKTQEEAEREGRLFARKWIDDGKPNLER